MTDDGVMEADEYVFRSVGKGAGNTASFYSGDGIPSVNVTVDVSKASGQLEVQDLMIVKELEYFRDVVVAAHGLPLRT